MGGKLINMCCILIEVIIGEFYNIGGHINYTYWQLKQDQSPLLPPFGVTYLQSWDHKAKPQTFLKLFAFLVLLIFHFSFCLFYLTTNLRILKILWLFPCFFLYCLVIYPYSINRKNRLVLCIVACFLTYFLSSCYFGSLLIKVSTSLTGHVMLWKIIVNVKLLWL
jgi:hypothetical protein